MSRVIPDRCSEHNHPVRVTIGDDGEVRAEIGTVSTYPLPDHGEKKPTPIAVACPSCIEKVRTISNAAMP